MRSSKRIYEPPTIMTYSSDDILEELGPAQACSPYWGSEAPINPDSSGYAPGLPPFHEPPARKKRGSWFGDKD